jgi:putative membrane protein
MNELPSPPPANPQIDLAKERNRAAAERTLMAWIRTCLSLISFGFGIDSIVGAILSFQPVADTVNPMRFSRLLGLSFIALGVYAMVAAGIEHQRELRHIRRNDAEYVYQPRRSLGLTVAIALIGIGVLAFISILLKLHFGRNAQHFL